ncbi:MAG TPA: FMN-binding protein [Planctomycetaceae bacterium]|nr:FMN-binding protein [Planctomycetaceae bacterium]
MVKSEDSRDSSRGDRFRTFTLQTVRVGIFFAAVLLVHLAHARRERATRFERLSTLMVEDLEDFFPDAVRLTTYDPDLGGQIVLDESGIALGYALQTSPLSDRIIGYSGPTNTLIAFDSQDRILGLRILQSGDTREHVAAVRRSENFFDSWKGLTRSEAVLLETVDAVSGSTLTSSAIQEGVTVRLGGARPSLKFPDTLELGEVRKFLPDASRITRIGSRYEIVNSEGVALGFALRTTPSADSVVGYEGQTDTLMVFSNDRRLLGIALRNSYDNEPFVGYVRDDEYFLTLFDGKSLRELAEFDDSLVEGVSGATMTSQAVARSMAETAQAVLSEEQQAVSVETPRWSPATRDWGTIAVLAGGLAIGFTSLKGRKWIRIPFLLVLIGYLGFMNGDLVSLAFLAGVARNGFPLQSAVGLCALTVAALSVPVFTKRQVYCHHLCPHGAVQQLVKRRLKGQIHIPRKVAGLLSAIPLILLSVGLLFAIRNEDFNLSDLEPFDAWLISIAGWASVSIAIVGLIASLFVPMAYCRFGCPTGALLNYLRKHAASQQWSRRDSFAILLLSVAVACYWFE